MLLHSDENVPVLVVEVFRARGHDVASVRDLHPDGTADPAVAKVAMQRGAVVVTWDHDFKTLASRRGYESLQVITFRCSEVEGRERAEKAIEFIEREYAAAVSNGRPLRIEITRTRMIVDD
ncbi:MAG: DUF5615 family PIN-like protein [Candidatus Dormibacteraceae bacterium]